MFATSDNPLNIIGNFKKISIIGNSMMSLWFIGTFCTNFLSYQLETWQMLADNNNNNIQMKSYSINYHRKQGDARDQVDEKFPATNTYLISSAQTGRGGRRSFREACSSTTTTTTTNNNKQLITMRTGSIDDHHHHHHQVSSTALPLSRPGSSQASWHPESSIAAPDSFGVTKDDGRNQSRFESRAFGGGETSTAVLSVDQIPQFNREHYLKQRTYQYQTHQHPSARIIRAIPSGGQNCTNPTSSTNFWSQTSMDEPHSEYLASRQLHGDFSSSPSSSNYSHQHALNYLSCHRTRNASYSSARMPNNYPLTSSMHPEFVQYLQHPSTALKGTLNMTNSSQQQQQQQHQHQNPKPLSHCSASSSGSLPAGLQFSNRHSCSGSFDISLEEPASLPLMNTAMNERSQVQKLAPNVYRHPINLIDHTQTTSNQISYNNNQIDTKGGYRWRHGLDTMDQRHPSVDKTAFGRQIFKHSIYEHPISVGSDSELYSHRQQIDRRAQVKNNSNNKITVYSNSSTTSTNRSTLGEQSTTKSDHFSDRRTLRHRNTSDTLGQAARQIERQAGNVSPNWRRSTTVSRVDGTAKKAGNGSKSDSKLSLAGTIRRLGFKQKGLPSLSVQRSEEVVPLAGNRQFLSQMGASGSFADSRMGSGSSLWISQQQTTTTTRSDSLDPRTSFIEGLGPGQIASRQALVSPYLGDIQLTLNDRRGMLEVEVVRARRLQLKAGTKSLPSPYVKLYLMKNKKCLAKSKTSPARRTLDPLYQQQFIFREDYTNCILQLIVWGDYGKKDRKSLMGIVQIRIDDIDITNLVIGWYRMFNAPSMAHSLVSSKALRHQLLSKTFDTD